MNLTKRLCGWTVGVLATVTLAACGGGGGDDPPAPAPTYALAAAYKDAVAIGSSTDYTVSGACSGRARFTFSVPVAVSWDGGTVLEVTETAAIEYTNCSPASSESASWAYYDLGYNPIATATANGISGRFQATANALPATVKVGDAGVFGTETLYSDEAQTVVAGLIRLSYRIEPDTPSTALAVMVSQVYGPDGELLSIQQTRYQLSARGSFTPVSIDVQYGADGTDRVVFTRQL